MFVKAVGEKLTSMKTIYRLNDSSFAFYYRYARRYIPLIEQELGAQIYRTRVKDSFSDYLGFVFEQVCREYLIGKNKRLEHSFLVEKFGFWWGRDPKTKQSEEINIIGVDENTMLIAKCEYTNKSIGMTVYKKLVERAALVRAESYHLYIFSKSGFEENLLALAHTLPNLTLFTFEEMIEDIGSSIKFFYTCEG